MRSEAFIVWHTQHFSQLNLRVNAPFLPHSATWTDVGEVARIPEPLHLP